MGQAKWLGEALRSRKEFHVPKGAGSYKGMKTTMKSNGGGKKKGGKKK